MLAKSSEHLTIREREIVGLVCKGLRNKRIADELGITDGTVKMHLHHVYAKFGLTGRGELVYALYGNNLMAAE